MFTKIRHKQQEKFVYFKRYIICAAAVSVKLLNYEC